MHSNIITPEEGSQRLGLVVMIFTEIPPREFHHDPRQTLDEA